MKWCARCQDFRPEAGFNKDSSRKDGLYPYCRPHQSRKNAKSYQDNRSARLASAAAYRDENRETIREKVRQYDATHDRAGRQLAYRQADPARTKAISKRYRQNNMAKVLDRCHARRARKYNNGPVERIYRRKVWERDDGICQVCRKPVEFKAMHLDHKIPLCKKGTHTYDNVQTTHAACNLAKGGS